MRKLVVLAVCAGLAACGWTQKRGGGTNYDPPSGDRIGKNAPRRL